MRALPLVLCLLGCTAVLAKIERVVIDKDDRALFPLTEEFGFAKTGRIDITLRDIAIDLAATEQGRLDLAKGMQKALALRCSFWSWLH